MLRCGAQKHRSKAVPEAKVWRFFIQLVAGLHHIHERNIVHRDIKALNIMLDKCAVSPSLLLTAARLSHSSANSSLCVSSGTIISRLGIWGWRRC